MLEKVKGISIKGRCFTSETQFSFYPESNDRIAIVYGKNGSGKSTLSEGFSFISSGNSSTDISATLLDRSGAPVSLAEESKIFVFNEKYIDENVKINDDGLGTIILLGGQVDLQSDIDRYTELEKSAKSDLEKAQGIWISLIRSVVLLAQAITFKELGIFLSLVGPPPMLQLKGIKQILKSRMRSSKKYVSLQFQIRLPNCRASLMKKRVC